MENRLTDQEFTIDLGLTLADLDERGLMSSVNFMELTVRPTTR